MVDSSSSNYILLFADVSNMEEGHVKTAINLLHYCLKLTTCLPFANQQFIHCIRTVCIFAIAILFESDDYYDASSDQTNYLT